MSTQRKDPKVRRHRRKNLPPGPRGWPIIGQALPLLRDPLGLFKQTAAYGDVATISVKPIPICLVNHPQLNREALVTNHQNVGRGSATYEVFGWFLGQGVTVSDGVYHRQQRRLMQPLFHRNQIGGYAHAIGEIVEETARSWSHADNVEMETEMIRLTARAILRTLLGTQLFGSEYELANAINECDRYMAIRLKQPPTLRRMLHRAPLSSSGRFRRARAHVDHVIYRAIADHRAGHSDENDLLTLLIQDEAELNDAQVRDELVSMYHAGHETAAATLTWAWHLLGEHPEAQEELHLELDRVLGGRAPTLSDLPQLTYTTQVITETLRLFPPLWVQGRMVYEPINIGGYDIPAGFNVVVCPYITQRDSRWYEQPHRFMPERWTDRFTEELPRFACRPFSGGPYQCLGEHFAWMELKVVLATLAQRWRVTPVPGSAVEMSAGVTLRTRRGLHLTLTDRTP